MDTLDTYVKNVLRMCSCEEIIEMNCFMKGKCRGRGMSKIMVLITENLERSGVWERW